MPNIFEGELESILLPISKNQISYSFGKFIIRLGLNHLNVENTHLPSLMSKNNSLVKNSTIVLDSMSLSLYIYDLQRNETGIDAEFFVKFNSEKILKRLRLDEIDELIT